MSEWISVEDRLPDAGRVIVYSPDSLDETMTCRIMDYSFVRISTDVTHWMPLPEPPKE